MSKQPIHFHRRVADYHALLNECLTCFQLLEETLKKNLVIVGGILGYGIKEYLPYDPKPEIKSLQNCALGTLIDKYSRYCDNQGLIDELKQLKKKRNVLAHRAFIISTSESHDETHMNEKTQEWDEIRERATSVINELLCANGDLKEKLRRAKRRES